MQSTRLARKGERVILLVTRTFTNVIFRVSNLANLNLHLRERNWNVRVRCIVSSNISWRGLTRVAYLDEGAMREPETWDKREVVTPTSFILNLKQLAETWENNRPEKK